MFRIGFRMAPIRNITRPIRNVTRPIRNVTDELSETSQSPIRNVTRAYPKRHAGLSETSSPCGCAPIVLGPQCPRGGLLYDDAAFCVKAGKCSKASG